MVNKRATPKEDPLVRVDILITQTQWDFLSSFGKSGRSKFIRGLINAQMNINPHAIEAAKLDEEKRVKEAELNIIDARIGRLKASDQRKQAAGKSRQLLLDEISERIAKHNRIVDFKDRTFIRMFKTNVEDANRKLNGGAEPITPDELKELIITKAKAWKRVVYDR